MRTTWTFHAPGTLIFGRDAVDRLGEVVEQLTAKRVLLVTDTSLVAAGAADAIRTRLEANRLAVDVFDEGKPEPPAALVERVVARAREGHADLLVGLGGGSNMDVAKAAAVVLAHGGAVIDYAGDQRVPGPVFPTVLLPTTAGTGSEVTAAAVLSDPQTGTKFSILSNYLRPKVALVDPLLTVSCPPGVTAASGIDALTHAVEAYTAVDNETFPAPDGQSSVYQGRHPLGDVLAERAIELVGLHLRRAVANGADLEAREGMSLAATLAGLAFSNVGVAVVHALEYALNRVAHTPHGVGCGLLLPYVMRFNLPVRRHRFARIAQLLGVNADMRDDERAAEAAIAAVEKLNADIQIPARMERVGVSAEQLPAMADTAFAVKRILRVNPRPVTLEDLQGILQSAL